MWTLDRGGSGEGGGVGFKIKRRVGGGWSSGAFVLQIKSTNYNIKFVSQSCVLCLVFPSCLCNTIKYNPKSRQTSDLWNALLSTPPPPHMQDTPCCKEE